VPGPSTEGGGLGQGGRRTHGDQGIDLALQLLDGQKATEDRPAVERGGGD
jgi:hypothetical protein